MVTDRQVGRLFRLMETEKTLGMAAAKAGMDEKTARKYLKAGQLPSELAAEHNWRTRNDREFSAGVRAALPLVWPGRLAWSLGSR